MQHISIPKPMDAGTFLPMQTKLEFSSTNHKKTEIFWQIQRILRIFPLKTIPKSI